MRRILLLLASLGILVSPARAEPWRDDLGRHVAEAFARPAVEGFSAAAAQQVSVLDALCESPNPAALDAAREAFGQTVETFGTASVLRFGPLTSDNRFERLFLWPDARGVAVRQVEALLAEPDEPIGDLGARSVALQGLPALEFALFGSGSDALGTASGAARCAFGPAVAGRIAATAGEIAGGWADGTPFASAFTQPSAATDPYRSQAEVASEIVKAIGTAIQFARDAELLPALGKDAAAANGRRGPLWRSASTFALARAQIEGAQDLLAAAGFEEALPSGARSNVASVRFDLRQAAAALGRIEKAPEAAFEDDVDREAIRYVTVALKNAQRVLNEQVTGDLGLRTGFNALDGD